jgi:arylsulfatase A-like enzyme
MNRPQRPNLLFIFTDEQRWDTLPCYGNDAVQAPNLERLAAQGAVFEHAYVTQSVCTPSRSSLMTGYYPHTTGCIGNNVALPADMPTIAELVPDDYARGYVGKWHLGDEVIAQHGFEEWVSLDDEYRAHYSRPEYAETLSDYHHFLVDNGFEPDTEEHGARVFSRPFAAQRDEPYTKARFVGARTADMVRRFGAGERPFMIYANLLEPHMPFTGPLNDLYDPGDVPTGPAFLQPPADDAALVNRMLSEYFMNSEWEGHDLRTEAGWRRIRANYLGLVTLVDNAVGEVLQALDDSGAADNTVVVFTSDHGDMMGDHGILAKMTQYEEAVRVPLMVRAPWLAGQGRRVHGRFSQIDLVPTLLDLLGQPAPEDLHGCSRVGALQGDGSLGQEDVFIEWNGRHGRNGPPFTTADDDTRRILALPWRTVICPDGWKLNLNPEDQCELYDLESDPYEQHNRFDDADQQERIADLRARIEAWQARTSDTAPGAALMGHRSSRASGRADEFTS